VYSFMRTHIDRVSCLQNHSLVFWMPTREPTHSLIHYHCANCFDANGNFHASSKVRAIQLFSGSSILPHTLSWHLHTHHEFTTKYSLSIALRVFSRFLSARIAPKPHSSLPFPEPPPCSKALYTLPTSSSLQQYFPTHSLLLLFGIPLSASPYP